MFGKNSGRNLFLRGKKKGKERKSIYIAPFIYYVHLKALRRLNWFKQWFKPLMAETCQP